jgi:uncharacterized Zn finger protein
MRFVPRSVRTAWHRKAMDAAEGADLGAALEIFLQAKEAERLIGRLRRAKNQELDILVHSIAEPVAAKLAKSHPELAARLYRSLAVSILKAKKNKAYGAALSHLEAACRAYERAGLGAEWEKLVTEIRSEHRLKTGIMPGFEALLRGDRPSVRPTFLERAKARWSAERARKRD